MQGSIARIIRVRLATSAVRGTTAAYLSTGFATGGTTVVIGRMKSLNTAAVRTDSSSATITNAFHRGKHAMMSVFSANE